MIRKTISKILIITLMVTMVIATVGQTTVSAEGSTRLVLDTNRIINGNKKEAYALNSDHKIYQIKEEGTTGTNTNTNFLCLNATVGNGWDGIHSVGDLAEYDKSFDLATAEVWTMNDLNSVYKNVLGTNGKYKGQILWLLDNMLIGSYYDGNTKKTYTETDIRNFLAKAGIKYGKIEGAYFDGAELETYYFDKSKFDAVNGDSAFLKNNLTLIGNPNGGSGYYYETTNGTKVDVRLSQELIETVEQAAIWYFTNGQENGFDYYTENNATDVNKFLKFSNGSEYIPLSTKMAQDAVNTGNEDDDHPYGKMLQEQASILYNYLIDAAKQYGTNYKSEEGKIKVEFAGSSTDKKIVKDGENYKVGPLKVNTEGNTTISGITVTTGSSTTAISGVTLQNASGTTISELTSGQNFYVLVPKSKVNGTINVKVTAKTLSVEKKLLIASTKVEQPVVEVIPKKANINDEIKIAQEKQFDLALRKQIVAINENSTENDIRSITSSGTIMDGRRTIKVDPKSIPETATYNHRKDPVVVKKDDIVTYRIWIYNEGEIKGYASKIVDQLPTGLEYVGIESNRNGTTYTASYDSATNKVTLTASTPKTINIFDGTTLSSDYVDVTCKVKQTASTDGKTKHFLTNIAYISEGFDTENNQPVTEDRNGSESKTTTSPTNTANQLNSTDANDYKGDTDNISVYADTNNDEYYKGMEDDDDFEKVVVLPLKFDLALRKFITKINNKDITNRVPVITASEIEKLGNGNATYDNGTTLEKSHSKIQLAVAKGNTIVYTIRVYNEGEVDGFASKVTDYLPAGLTFKTYTTGDGSINDQNGWIADGQKITTTKLADQLIQAFDKNYEGGTGLFYKDLQVECIVNDNATSSNLKNIAEITEAKDKDGNTVEDTDSEPDNVNTDNYDPTNPDKGRGEEDDDDYEDLKLAEYDLALRKFISKVSTDGNFNTVTEITGRAPQVDSSKLKAGTEETAIYNHSKEPVLLNVGDYVLFTIRAYNEGDLAGYASQIIDYLPNYLDFVESTDSYIKGINDKWTYDATTRKVTTKADSANATTKLAAFDAQNDDGKGSGLSFVDVQIVCKVNKNAPANRKLTNIAEITEYKDEDGNVIVPTTGDRDSKPTNFPEEQKSETTRPDYNGGEDKDSSDNYIPGQEDDDDFEKVIVRERKVDLALTKFIAAVSKDVKIEEGEYLTPNKNKGSKTNEYLRATVADTTGLKAGTSSNATYTPKKDLEPLAVGKNSYVLYNIRVYNEGEVDVYAGEITDYLPENLEFVDAGESKTYGWTANGQTVKTTYLSSKNGTDKILKAFDKVKDDGKGSGMDYVDLQILCRVSDKAESGKKMVNTAEITKYEDEDGKEFPKDFDSSSDNKEEKNVENRSEDDDDYEVVIIKDFDLALRKFITKIGGKDIDFRIPKLSYENGKITYTHPKDVLKTTVADTVTYTLRVFNEGDIAGFAQEITDDIPEHLEFLPEDATNREYKWVMYDKDGKSTTNVSEAVKIKTDYTSKSNGELLMKENSSLKENPNLLKAFDKKAGITNTNPDYVDVKVAFKVKDPKSNKAVIVNKAQISDDSDEDGNPVEDVDSTPDKWNDGEDDQDYENIGVEYFDLSLLKYVTKAIVTENGKTKTTKTGNNGSDKDITPKVEVYRKSLNKTIVKFEYTIKITNEGDIAGYAKEITDYVPKGLKFFKEDNKGWKDEGNNVISTKLLKDTLLQPGQSATVKVILRWVNGENNLGVKTNVAEISEDYNEKGVPDRDSTPDNKKPKEDDIDDAPVLLTISTGMLEHTIQYVTGALVILVVLGLGIVVIKKYVL